MSNLRARLYPDAVCDEDVQDDFALDTSTADDETLEIDSEEYEPTIDS
jgi:hypothetical protein